MKIKHFIKTRMWQILIRYPTYHKPLKIQHPPKNRPKVLVLGIYLAYKQNTFDHLIKAFDESLACDVDQYWVSIHTEDSLKNRGCSHNNCSSLIFIKELQELKQKFIILNDLIQEIDINKYDYIVFSDDDITVDANFLDSFIGWQQYLNFCLAQPARTRTSSASHEFVLSRPWLNARETRFVEIGPIFSIHKSIVNELLPFDAESPMGWGYDFVWPVKVNSVGKKMGIIDATPVEHSLRPQGDAYSFKLESENMRKYLLSVEHLSLKEACTTIKSHTKIRSFIKNVGIKTRSMRFYL